MARQGAALSIATGVTPQQFAEIERLFFEARDLPEGDWPRFLQTSCGDDARVRSEVEALLRTATRLGKHPSHGPSKSAQPSHCAEGMTRRLVGALLPPAPEGGELLVGQRVEKYEICELVGRGGMGVVYKARDVALNRTVALKALPHAVADCPEHLGRLRREAKLLASLSHPGIATIYDLAEHGPGNSAILVMEFIDGRTLAEQLARGGALPIEAALRISAAIAEAVEAAHAAGVIHRDLKPANVMIARGGAGSAVVGDVKVLDFGLACAAERKEHDGSPGSTTAILSTSAGNILGTPGYMSPEQLRGLELDRRCDVFAFGCVLYECLSGEGAFGGSSNADIVASVLEREPDWSKLPPRTPLSVRRLLQRCLAKDLNRRFRDMGDVRLELEDALAAREWTAPAPPSAKGKPRRRVIANAMALLLVLVLLGALWLRPRSRAAEARPALQRFTVPFPGGLPQSDLAHIRLALSRDGGRMVVTANDGKSRGMFVRDRDRGEFRRIDSSPASRVPSFSPDGQWLAYFDDGMVSKLPLAGGKPVRLCLAQGYWSPYAWTSDGYITFNAYWGRGIARIRSDGGKSEYVTQPDYAKEEFAHISPYALPDGSAILYTVWNGKSGTKIDAINLSTKQRHTVVEDASCPRVVPTPRGTYLLFERTTTIYAAPFDMKTLRRTGPEVAIADNVLYDVVLFTAVYDASDDGTLAYVQGPRFSEESRLAWLTPGEKTTVPLNNDRFGLVEPSFSADGNKLSIIRKGDVFQPYLYDLKAGTCERIVVDGDVESAAISPDGTTLAYCSNHHGPYEVFVKRLPDGGEQKIFDATGDCPGNISWSPDGKTILLAVAPDDRSARNVYVVDVASKKTIALCDTREEERAPRWSPDGRWVAYVSAATGAREIYLKSYPDGTQQRQISFDGGDWPMWSPDGGKLYYRLGGALYAVPINPRDGTLAGRPQPMYDGYFGQGVWELPDYTVHPDGRLLLVEPSERGPKVPHINVVLNWHRLLDK